MEKWSKLVVGMLHWKSSNTSIVAFVCCENKCGLPIVIHHERPGTYFQSISKQTKLRDTSSNRKPTIRNEFLQSHIRFARQDQVFGFQVVYRRAIVQM